jgi:hypothetical protein
MAISVRQSALALAFATMVSGSALAQPASPPASASAPASSAVACPAPGAKPETVVIAEPTWVRHPDSEEVFRAYPAFALKTQKDDQTTIDCAVSNDGELQNCTVVSDKKPGLGFDKASLGLAKLYKMTPPSSIPGYAGLPDCIRNAGPPHVRIDRNWRH